MAEVSGHRDISPLEDTLEDSSRDGEGQKPRAPTTLSVVTKKRKSRSKYTQLEEKWNAKFGNLNSKLDSMFDIIKGQTSTANGDKNTSESGNTLSQRQSSSTPSLSQRQSGSSTSQSQRQTRRSRDSDSESADERDDVMSLQPGQNEVLGSGTESDNEGSNDEHLSSKAKKSLFDIFGEDAIAKKTEKKMALPWMILKRGSNGSLGCAQIKFKKYQPLLMETEELFPVDEETEKFLQVPTLDDFIGNCLVKRHGSKASFSKGKNLHSQPYKMLERIAYRGQQASFMGIVICMYMQQSLGNLLELLTDETPNIDKAIQQVRDIFAMSTKELDQAGRAGAFHHIIRRQMCMTDTSMFLLHDSRDISDLPLTGEGVFGDNLVSALKARKDKDKTLDDLLPDIFPKDRKRKTPLTDDSSKAKKSKIEKSDQNKDKTSENFRIPKVYSNTGNRKFIKKTDDGKFSKPDTGYKKTPFPARGGKSYRK
ncbi:unnamed protein product [Mytilus edulis]|uniref:Uncharacterized protein n=2 Tax=Mytilus TaxID=6548 RepID=A0A8S3RF30_MYTED|nr:unnamed protein product [Mytilus edulis]